MSGRLLLDTETIQYLASSLGPTELEVSAWWKQSQNGTQFLSLNVKLPWSVRSQMQPQPQQPAMQPQQPAMQPQQQPFVPAQGGPAPGQGFQGGPVVQPPNGPPMDQTPQQPTYNGPDDDIPF